MSAAGDCGCSWISLREEAAGSRDYAPGQVVGINVHRRRGVICRMSADGEVLESTRIDNDPAGLLREVAKAGPGVPVALEATYGSYWAVETCRSTAPRCTWRIRRG